MTFNVKESRVETLYPRLPLNFLFCSRMQGGKAGLEVNFLSTQLIGRVISVQAAKQRLCLPTLLILTVSLKGS